MDDPRDAHRRTRTCQHRRAAPGAGRTVEGLARFAHPPAETARADASDLLHRRGRRARGAPHRSAQRRIDSPHRVDGGLGVYLSVSFQLPPEVDETGLLAGGFSVHGDAGADRLRGGDSPQDFCRVLRVPPAQATAPIDAGFSQPDLGHRPAVSLYAAVYRPGDLFFYLPAVVRGPGLRGGPRSAV